MKRLVAILFGALLLAMQLAPAAPATAPALPCCAKMATGSCGAMPMCGHRDCCAVHPSSPDSKSAPAVPAPSASQEQLTFSALAVVAWTMPETRASFLSPDAAPTLISAAAPLYRRDCALLL